MSSVCVEGSASRCGGGGDLEAVANSVVPRELEVGLQRATPLLSRAHIRYDSALESCPSKLRHDGRDSMSPQSQPGSAFSRALPWATSSR